MIKKQKLNFLIQFWLIEAKNKGSLSFIYRLRIFQNLEILPEFLEMIKD